MTDTPTRYPTQHGYMTESAQRAYITRAVETGILPRDAHRMADIISLEAPTNLSKPIQFWQLHSVLGQQRILRIVYSFYERVFADEPWFTSVFERVGGIRHHTNTQGAMWVDVMGGGHYYHGADFRLNFHHTHNALELMTEKGAERWTKLMVETLDHSASHMTDDPRVRTSINTFLDHFMGKYAADFDFENRGTFAPTNAPLKRKINFMAMTSEAIEALSEDELRTALTDRGVDVVGYGDKRQLVEKAMMV